MTCAVAPCVGRLVDARGFAPPAALLVLATQLCLGVLLLRRAGGGRAARGAAPRLALALYNAVQALAYTLEFAYLNMTFRPDEYPALIAATVLLQGVVGLIAWPFLAEVEPFGARWNAQILLLLLPTAVLYYWLLLEWRRRAAASASPRPPRNAHPRATTPWLPGAGDVAEERAVLV